MKPDFNAPEAGSPEASDGERGSDFTSVHRKAQAAERRTLSELRTYGTIGDDAFHRVEEELDWAELNTEGMEQGN
jgi:CPA1 family monovalent cation:H+ antiporter